MYSRFFSRGLSFSRSLSFVNSLSICPDVSSAITSGLPIVALESTLITHGLPFPDNLKTAKSLESIVRSEGAIPATIAVLNGCIRIGLSSEELHLLASSTNVRKLTTRDLPMAMATNMSGGTTVAATMFLAHKAGIRIFATGGIGGVHRGAEETFDISADLIELSRSSVSVVCAGVKSILDVPKTLEYMETQGIPIVVFDSNSHEFPGFFTRNTGCKVSYATEDVEQIVDLIENCDKLSLSSRPVIACPIPKEYAEIEKSIESAISSAIQETRKENITNQQVTPFLLKRINELTAGKSLVANVGLLENNARIASKLAIAYSRRQTQKIKTSDSEIKVNIRPPRVIVFGATIVDFEAITPSDVQFNGGTYEGELYQTCGGVARNHADALTRLGLDVSLVSSIGYDINAQFVRDYCKHMDLSEMISSEQVSTAAHLAICVQGSVRFGIGAIREAIALVTPSFIKTKESAMNASDFVLLDANLSVEATKTVIEMAASMHKPVWFEPTDLSKMCNIFESGCFHLVDTISPNALEFKSFCTKIHLNIDDTTIQCTNSMRDFLHLHADQLMESLNVLIVTLSHHGSVILRRNDNKKYDLHILPNPLDGKSVKSVSGAGDCLNSGLLAGRLSGMEWKKCYELANQCSAASLLSDHPVPAQFPKISFTSP